MLRKTLYSAFTILGRPAYRRAVQASYEPGEAQMRRLRAILSANEQSRFGREHDFSRIRDYEDFKRAVPVRDYEGFSSYIDSVVNGEQEVLTVESPFMFATTSGTTGKPKYIPITDSYMREYRAASVVSGYCLAKHFPGISSGIGLPMVSPAQEGLTPSGIPYGAMTGAIYKSEPYLIRKFIGPIPYEVFLIDDYESRYYTILRLALVLPVSIFFMPNPSNINLLCRKLQQYADQLIKDVRDGTTTPPAAVPKDSLDSFKGMIAPDPVLASKLEQLNSKGMLTPEHVWPMLAVVSCWTKAAAAFYLEDISRYFGNTPICEISYGASEGRGTMNIEPDKQMLALNSHFYEFIPESEIDAPRPTALMAGQLTEGQNYSVLFTTSGGLYRYRINDIVRVSGFYNEAPLIEFQYKSGNVSSFTGEKVTELQVTGAMQNALKALGASVRFFTVIPQFRPEPHYQLWVEPEQSGQADRLQSAVQSLAGQFDSCLSSLNIEYEGKRSSGRLAAPDIRLIAPGTYESYRKELVRAGTPDAQIKVSHLNPKGETREFFQTSLMEETSRVALTAQPHSE